MTIQAMTDATTGSSAKTVKGSPKWGDLLLRVVAGLVLLYLFLPIFVIVLFSFNDPKGKFNYSWQGFTLENWADPFKYPALTEALKLSINGRVTRAKTRTGPAPRSAAASSSDQSKPRRRALIVCAT